MIFVIKELGRMTFPSLPRPVFASRYSLSLQIISVSVSQLHENVRRNEEKEIKVCKRIKIKKRKQKRIVLEKSKNF